MRRRYQWFIVLHRKARERGVKADRAIIEAARASFSQKVKRSDEWCLKKGRAILRLLERRDLTSPPAPASLNRNLHINGAKPARSAPIRCDQRGGDEWC